MDGLVLSGGGAYGAYELGAIKALFEKGVLNQAGVVTGTSVGAFNAAVLCMHGGGAEALRRLEDVWLHVIAESKSGTPNGVLRLRGNPLSSSVRGFVQDSMYLARAGFDRGTAFFSARGGIFSRSLELVDISAFISVEPLKRTIASEISCAQIRESPVQLRVVATDWERGGYRVFTNADLTSAAILASTAIPSLFPPVHFDNTTWVDGGVTMNTPLKPAVQAGANVIHVVSLDASLHRVAASELDNTVEAMMRTLSIAIATAIREDMSTAAWINHGLAALEKARSGEELTSEEVRDFVRVAAQLEQRARGELQLQPVTIHHYHPIDSLGGPLGLLNFGRDAVMELIARGRRDALAHDCKESGCVLA